MKHTNSTNFAMLITGFLIDYLPLQRCYSKNTILSYKDALKLFLLFLTEHKGVVLNTFTMADFSRGLVIEFLEWCRNRGSSSSTANQRLAALKTFADYSQVECIECIAPLQNIMGIKSKKSTVTEVSFLTVEQTKTLINRPDINSSNGLRHRAALTLLYDSGCRVQELCDLTLADIQLSENATIRLHGKGDKYRTVIISNETASLITKYICQQRKQVLNDQPVIINRLRKKIDRDGISYIIDKYVQDIIKTDPLFPTHVNCHMLRHYGE